ncbi:Release factor glutamine methyltransferase [Candidatus Rhabdochlamydia oedothoracis]|uniref:Release factor glutamine methyltransferase n=1 Tax=Candidatus Rhabdochlamydia oedothoracis TaxID=2720720 RepID=A0ABX8V002_9BACT|nr:MULTISPECIES: peptide chain release factor N(5)-glutamine methyltransferase [Rhabdochlamydia]KAG6559370.1 Release factor glutamine methyltransferase [Candidatus Rhabdochlamydia sp. W815]MCL6756347.1 peptide chain release factor N(5)-glutamine methyltransferase [Candidatus Rhabdochlamydia oedothoracis]QYF48525.1 Release factor glutamine methyltransferase [Candidatus Rhabdochlamydia oedothoracis]
MRSLGEVLQIATQFLQQKEIVQAKRSAEDLLAFVLKKSRLDLYLQFDLPLEEKELEHFCSLVKRLSLKEPIEYILGRIEFYNCLFSLNPFVLIPRPETEILLDHICREIELEEKKPQIAWDICTGSGCLGVGLKKRFPFMNITLSDLCPDALHVASLNAKQNQVEVEVLLGDFLKPFEGKKVDLVICNPPYVSLSEYETLDLSVKGFEPKQAFVAEENGLAFYRLLSQQLPQFLNQGAKVYLEIGATQGQKIKELFASPSWTRVLIEKDLSGHDRFFFLEFES